MNSVGHNQEARVDSIKTKPKFKISKIFNSFIAKMSPSKLTVDAVPVNSKLTVARARTSATNEFEQSRLNSIDSWPRTDSEDFERASFASEDASSSQLMLLPSLFISPNANHLPLYGLHNTTNDSLAVTNVAVQNNFNLSDINGLHIGNVNVFQDKATPNGISNDGNHAAEQGNEASSSAPRIWKTKSIKELLDSTDPLDGVVGKKAMRILSKHMGASWRFTLREMGFTDGAIDQKCSAYLNLKDGVFEIVYLSLLEWSRKNVDMTVGQLCTFLWAKEQRECVLEFKNHLKRERKRNVLESSSTAENGIDVESTKKSTEDDPVLCDGDKWK